MAKVARVSQCLTCGKYREATWPSNGKKCLDNRCTPRMKGCSNKIEERRSSINAWYND